MLSRIARGVLRASAAALLTLVLMPVYGLAPRSAHAWRRRIQVLWCRAMLRLTGLRVVTDGAVNGAGVTVFCANHVSYLDILVLSSRIAGTFVAKSDVAGWPVFGRIATMTGTILVDRTPGRARAQRAAIRARLAAGENLILFPEGTSTDGGGVAPFKSALLDLATPEADGPETWVQPVSIAYVRDRRGRPLTGARRDRYAWYGAMTLVPHLLNVLSRPGAEVHLTLHPPLRATDFANRKALARESEAQVAAGIAAAFGAVPVPAEAAAE